jgi:hypothetical protein
MAQLSVGVAGHQVTVQSAQGTFFASVLNDEHGRIFVGDWNQNAIASSGGIRSQLEVSHG